MDVREYKDVETLLDPIVRSLESIAGSLLEVRANSEDLVTKGLTITVTMKIGGPDD